MPIFNSRTVARISALLASTALFGIPAQGQAQGVGKAAAVNPATEGVQNGNVRTLRLGSDVVRNETIRTSASGSTQILFIDKTTLNVGPSSSVTIDEYVFNPDANTGQATITLGKGLMRFVGGEISHNDSVKIKTPVATITVRGGTVTLGYTADGLRVILHYGEADVANACGSVVLSRGGYAVTVAGAGECPSDPEQATKQEIKEALNKLSSGPGQTGGGTFTGTGPKTSQTFEGNPFGPPDKLDELLDDLKQWDNSFVPFGNDIWTGGNGNCSTCS
jgi:hypothetical protein